MRRMSSFINKYRISLRCYFVSCTLDVYSIYLFAYRFRHKIFNVEKDSFSLYIVLRLFVTSEHEIPTLLLFHFRSSCIFIIQRKSLGTVLPYVFPLSIPSVSIYLFLCSLRLFYLRSSQPVSAEHFARWRDAAEDGRASSENPISVTSELKAIGRYRGITCVTAECYSRKITLGFRAGMVIFRDRRRKRARAVYPIPSSNAPDVLWLMARQDRVAVASSNTKRVFSCFKDKDPCATQAETLNIERAKGRRSRHIVSSRYFTKKVQQYKFAQRSAETKSASFIF